MLIWFIQLPITGLQPLYQGVKKDLDILHQSRFFSLVPEDGLEPSWVAPEDFESSASTDFTTRAAKI